MNLQEGEKEREREEERERKRDLIMYDCFGCMFNCSHIPSWYKFQFWERKSHQRSNRGRYLR